MRRLRRSLRAVTAVVLLTTGCSAHLAANEKPDLSIPAVRAEARRTVIYARDGSILNTLAGENRVPVPLSRLPLQTRWAFVAAEDKRFYEHHGIDPFAVARALKENKKAGYVVEGASTITEQ